MSGRRKPLSMTHPAIAADWHPCANGDLGPSDVTASSKVEAVWLCHGETQHEIRQRVDGRVGAGGCRLCNAAGQLESNNLLIKFPDVARQWHTTKNAGLSPKDVAPTSHKRVWWQCNRNPAHTWQAMIHLRTAQNKGCPYCAGQAVNESNSLATLRPEVAAEWHPTKNGRLTPNDVTLTTNKRPWWRCGEGHEWQTEIANRTTKDNGCPYCSEFYLNDKHRLSSRFPEIAAEWHPTKNRALWPKFEGGYSVKYNTLLAPEDKDYGSRRQLRPSDLFAGSKEEVWWQCSKSKEHVWKASVKSRTFGKERCPFCTGDKVCSDNNLAVLCPGLAKLWHSRNGALLPTQVTPSSHRLAWWRCFKNAEHVWRDNIDDVFAAYSAGNNPCLFCREIKVNGTDAF